MLAKGEQVHLRLYPVALERQGEKKAVFHGHGGVRPGVPKEGGGRMGGDLGLQGIAQVHIEVVRAGEVFKGAAMGLFAAGDNGIAEHQGVGLYLLGGKAQLSPQVGPGPPYAQAGGAVSPGGKAHDGDFIRVGVGLPGMGAHPGHRGGGILLGTGIAVGRHPIPGHKGIEAHGRKDQGYGLRLPGGKVPVSAAGADDHRRALNIGINLPIPLTNDFKNSTFEIVMNSITFQKIFRLFNKYTGV